MVQTIEERNDNELKRTLDNEMAYDKAMGTYKLLGDELERETKTYVNDYHGVNYSGSNVDIGSHVGYVTKHGIFKHYPNKRVFEKTAGKNGCPRGSGEQVPIENSRMYDREGAILPSDPKMIVGSRMISGQGCGKEGENVYVTHVGSPEKNTYVGCYTDKSNKGIPELQSEGNVFTASMCKERANDLGKSVYGLQNYNPKTKKGDCYVGDSLSDAKQFGTANKPEATWSTRTDGTDANALLFAKNGNISLHKINDNLDSVYKSTTLSIPVGGSAKNLRSVPLPYLGLDVNPKPTNPQNPSWKDTFSAEVDGDTLNVRRIDQGTGWGQNLQLSGKTYTINNALWSSKEQIGNCPVKFRKSTDTSSIVKVPDICKGAKLIMQDDGNLVVYDNKNKAIWASNTWNKIGDVVVEEWLEGTFKNRDYMKGGEILQTGDWIASKSGKNRAILQEDGNFVVYRSREGCVRNGKSYYGKEDVNAVYQISGSNNKNVGKIAYIDNNTNLYEYPNELVSRGTRYKKMGNYDSEGNTIKTVGGQNKIKISVGGSNSVTKVIDLPEDNLVVDPTPMNSQNPSWNDRFSTNVSGRKLTVTRIDQNSGWGQNLQLEGRKNSGVVESVNDCKNACNVESDCAGFVYKPRTQTCYLKDGGMFPKGSRFPDDELDLYLRLPKVSNDNSCSNNVATISSTRYATYPESSEKMSKSKSCTLEAHAAPMRNALRRQDDRVQDSLNAIAEDMDYLKKENNKYRREERKMRKKVKKGFKEMTHTHNLMEHRIKNTTTVEAKAEDSQLMYIGENYQYIFFTIGAIVTVTAMLKLLPRVTTEQ